MERSKKRLLLNAEPFGFGPTAAIASFFPHLRERFEKIGFIGSNHTLDLQRNLAYDSLHDISSTPSHRESEVFGRIAKDYDIFLTAMDFSMAKNALASGLRTCIYDALTWYWPQIRDVSKESQLYLAQDFIGVKERIDSNRDAFSEIKVVSPIIPEEGLPRGREHVLINLGGLQNPFWSVDEATTYARKVLQALMEVIPENENLIITTSNAVGKGLQPAFKKTGVNNHSSERLKASLSRSFTRDEMRKLIADAAYTFMTPGLGNIYDVARYAPPTIWLPPANDSQGQQLDMICVEEIADGVVDWKDIISKGINYRGIQTEVLTGIISGINELEPDELAEKLAEEIKKVSSKERSKTEVLIDRFGTNGEKQVAEHMYTFAEHLG